MGESPSSWTNESNDRVDDRASKDEDFFNDASSAVKYINSNPLHSNVNSPTAMAIGTLSLSNFSNLLGTFRFGLPEKTLPVDLTSRPLTMTGPSGTADAGSGAFFALGLTPLEKSAATAAAA